MIVFLHRLANKDLREAQNWYASKSTRTEKRFIAAFDEAIVKVEENPEIGSPIHDSIRWVRLKKFPYLVIYQRYRQMIEVFAVSHTKRRPGYWLRRTKKA